VWAFIQQTVPGLAPNADTQASLDVQPDPEHSSSKVTDRTALRLALEVFASPSSPAYPSDEAAEPRDEGDAPHEGPEHAVDMRASVNVLAQQMLSLADVASAHQRDIKALQARCQQLEEREQAIMVAFTAFFHVLAAGKVAKLEDISAVLHSIIDVAHDEAHPQESVRFLQSLAAMVHGQPDAGSPDGETRD
jgi:hypothetical protein